MIQMGDAIVIFGVFGTVTTAIIKLVPKRRSNDNGVCPSHSGLLANIENTERRLSVIETDTKEILKYVKMK